MINILILLGKIALAVLPILALLKFIIGKRSPVKGRIIEGEIIEENNSNNKPS